MPPCFSRGIPAAECCLWVPPPSPDAQGAICRADSGRGVPSGREHAAVYVMPKKLSLHGHKHYHYESIAYKRQPPQGGEHFYRLVRGCPDARSPRHWDGDRPHRDEGHAGLYRLREMCGTGALRLFRCRVYRRAGEACRGRRPCGRLAGLLCRAERFALRAARPRVLFVRPRLPQPWLSVAVAGRVRRSIA